MIKNVQNFTIPQINGDFAEVRIACKAVNAEDLTAEDFVALTNVSNITANWNTETKENDFYGNKGKTTGKVAQAPSIELEIVYADTAEHKWLLKCAKELGMEGMVQVECDTFDGQVFSMIANVIGENFSAAGARSDDAVFNVSLAYAGGEWTLEPKATE